MRNPNEKMLRSPLAECTGGPGVEPGEADQRRGIGTENRARTALRDVLRASFKRNEPGYRALGR